MNVVLIVPTGIGAEIGGHSGDATPVARLIGSLCNNLIIHPNVVNASDINEMPENALYVEGSMLDEFLKGNLALRKVRSNTVCVAINPPASPEIVNTVSAARAILGMDAFVIVLDKPLKMTAMIDGKGVATGLVDGWEDLVEQVKSYKFGALAVCTPVDVPKEVELDYLQNGGTNPWGGVEAILSKLVYGRLGRPVAHAPYDDSPIEFKSVVDPRISAEMLSSTSLFSVLKGLNKAPQPATEGLKVEDIACMISPIGCVGLPHGACFASGIPMLIVKENRTVLAGSLFTEAGSDSVLYVENYLEAAGIIVAMRIGLDWRSVRRPLEPTRVIQSISRRDLDNRELELLLGDG